ncbi:MAG: DUF2778 domain-containing protein [Patescibacteria group bacterium]|nr:DUF2778 domain-containing protein [Patescibacteria group bacterium]
MWAFSISKGILTNGNRNIPAYSGRGEYKNNPSYCSVPDAGPIPIGRYYIGPAFTSPIRGPLTMRLTPAPGNEMHGRSAFEIHGDSIEHPGQASDGCIVTSGPEQHTDREYIDDSNDTLLVVTA